MKYIGRVLGWILLGINICMAVLLLICAYSSYINPVAHPVWSCAGLAFPAFLITNVLFFFFWLVVYRRYALVSLLTFSAALVPSVLICLSICSRKNLPGMPLKYCHTIRWLLNKDILI